MERSILRRWEREQLQHPGRLNSNAILNLSDSDHVHLARPIFDAGITQLILTRRTIYSMSYDGTIGKKKTGVVNIWIVIDGAMEFRRSRTRKVAGPGTICIEPLSEAGHRNVAESPACCIIMQLEEGPFWQPLVSHGLSVRKYEMLDCMHELVNRLLLAAKSEVVAERCIAPGLAEAVVALVKREVELVRIIPSEYLDVLTSLHGRIEENPADDWTAERMAREAGLPQRTLIRHCRRVFGTSPFELVHNKRLRIAVAKLSAGIPPRDVAAEVGYSNYSAFSNMFERHMGMRPKDFTRSTRQNKQAGRYRRPGI